MEGVAIPVSIRVLADQLTPVLAYRRLVAPDERTAPSFLLESVEGGERQGRYSILGAHPLLEVVAHKSQVRLLDHRPSSSHEAIGPIAVENPLAVLRAITRGLTLVKPGAGGGGGVGGSEVGGQKISPLPSCFLGGWVGFAGYDTVRYVEPGKLPFSHAPRDDRGLPDLHMALYDGVVVFDHVAKTVELVQIAIVAPGDSDAAAGRQYDLALAMLKSRLSDIERSSKVLMSGRYEPEAVPTSPLASNMSRAEFDGMLGQAMEYIRAGDIFQIVLGQRFERRSSVDPFDVYRALRTVNPSPYMVYMQGEGTILVASSPEILCRVRGSAGKPWTVTNRPLAGTRRRGSTPDEDIALEKELLADDKERAEHVMLVDLARNDVGQVAKPGTVATPTLMEIERYSHVMHISSTVTGELRDGLDCWDALRAALPVGTISGAPKIRSMEIIDELEPHKRGPYGGGMGYVGLDGQMDIALALRTMVVPTAMHTGKEWVYHLQAAAGIVADSKADAEFAETVAKSAALARAIDVAEHGFGA
jgi:anthranilate synthase component I